MPKRIGILTGGGDVPGLNSVIKGVVYSSTDNGWSVTGLRRGWESLTHVNFDDEASVSRYIIPLNKQNTARIDRTGGTWLHTSRTNPCRMKTVPEFLDAKAFTATQSVIDGVASTMRDMTPRVLSNLEHLKIDCLVAIGGDDTLSYAAHLHRQGVKVVAVPKTMDNDVQNTEYCIGFSTAISRAMEAIERQRTTVASHERIGVFRVFGRDAGFTALYTAYATSIRCCIPEYKVDLEKLISVLVEEKRANPSNYALIILSEGAQWLGYRASEYGETDSYGHRKKTSVGEALSDELGRHGAGETIVSDLTYDLRGGSPDFIDRMVASTFAGMAIDLIRQDRYGVMTAIRNGCYAVAEIPAPDLGPRHVDVGTMYNTERFRPLYTGKIGLPVFMTRA